MKDDTELYFQAEYICYYFTHHKTTMIEHSLHKHITNIRLCEIKSKAYFEISTGLTTSFENESNDSIIALSNQLFRMQKKRRIPSANRKRFFATVRPKIDETLNVYESHRNVHL